MSCESLSRRAVLVALLAAAALPGLAAPPSLAPFGATSWQHLQQSLPRPAIVVFTTTDCAHCPAVLAGIDAERHRHRPLAPLVLVVMDLPPGPADGEGGAHFRHADRLYGFDGTPERLRYTVDPGWIGVTPYVALLEAGAPPRFVMGRPGPDAWARLWPRSPVGAPSGAVRGLP